MDLLLRGKKRKLGIEVPKLRGGTSLTLPVALSESPSGAEFPNLQKENGMLNDS